ncbi:PP2C family protein-serine/threonine phosphatase [Brevibacillus brevis]|uniref:PP2C family protein-serine/threonine phosphatase n=1 Tax=Brevibacillus brevis TaxID=1393 RepID=A0ABY9TDU0_BREBE|nr:PP2C family protein-serine/threonine phosphatase [Brevibacillus brevis]WNC16693.1 PP2C family protein-serine/threonine phosphatase [Brevibacillus brevis]
MIWEALFYAGAACAGAVLIIRSGGSWSSRRWNKLSKMLGLRQDYEHLLTASNENSLRNVSFETLQQNIEELVEIWYSKLDTLVYLRISLESEYQIVYFQVERGKKHVLEESSRVSERIIVHEQLDSILTPRYVVLEAHTVSGDSRNQALERSFFQLLLVNVRSLVLRCLHEHQAGELRLMETEMELARRIQSTLLPREQLTLPELSVRVVYAPFTYVGGDYIDYIRVDERYTCFIVADVSGHGLAASLLASGVRTAVRAILQKSWSPDEVLSRLNQLLYDDLSKTRSYITMLIAMHDAKEHTLLLSRAGHPRPLFLSNSRKEVLPSRGGVGLGLSPDSTYQLEKVPLRESGILLLYTDGLVETGRKDAARCVETWLADLSHIVDEHGEGEGDAMDRVEAYMWQITREREQTDDMSVLIIQFHACLMQPYPDTIGFQGTGNEKEAVAGSERRMTSGSV